jgi:pyruvate dehydrogenase E2 component (dihydrolipoamide acetyltransferase)
MAYEFKLPDIGEGVVEGEIVRWLVAEGDQVGADQPMVEVMTDKATVEIPAPRAGRILRRMFAEGQICPVGQVLVSIEESGAAAPPARPAAAPTRESGASVAAAAQAGSAGGAAAGRRPSLSAPAGAGAGATAAADVLATPATRKLARELEVDLGAVTGSGPAGRITSEDVKAHARGGGPRPASNGGAPAQSFTVPPAVRGAGTPASTPAGPDVRVPFRGVRRKIAEHMVRARREAAHYTYVEEVDCSQLVDLREKANARLAAQDPKPPLKLSYLPFIVRATVEALRRFPQMNAWLDEAAGEIVQRRQYHIGLATATADGLIVPVLRDADRRSIIDIGREIDRLAALTKAGKAGREELSGSTFTVTSLGQLGGVLATPILNHPEVGILGVHKIAKRPAVLGDKIVVKDLMNLSISVDHRVVDGYDAARFVADIKQSLESPGLLFLESV